MHRSSSVLLLDRFILTTAAGSIQAFPETWLATRQEGKTCGTSWIFIVLNARLSLFLPSFLPFFWSVFRSFFFHLVFLSIFLLVFWSSFLLGGRWSGSRRRSWDPEVMLDLNPLSQAEWSILRLLCCAQLCVMTFWGAADPSAYHEGSCYVTVLQHQPQTYAGCTS